MFPTLFADANKTAASLMEASMENVRNTQETMKRQREILSGMEFPWQIKWPEGKTGVPTLTYKASSAESTREMFHLMADANMRSWEQAAKAWASVPSWAKIPYTAPGEFLANWFDQWREGKFDGTRPVHVEAMFEALTKGVKKAETMSEFVPDVPASTAPAEAAAETIKTATETAEEIVADTTETVEDIVETAADASEDLFKPELLAAAKGDADDLTQIKGIGPKLSQSLNDLGIWHLSQIAAWTPENIGWIDDQLSFKGRIQREGWVEQAQSLL